MKLHSALIIAAGAICFSAIASANNEHNPEVEVSQYPPSEDIVSCAPDTNEQGKAIIVCKMKDGTTVIMGATDVEVLPPYDPMFPFEPTSPSLLN